MASKKLGLPPSFSHVRMDRTVVSVTFTVSRGCFYTQEGGLKIAIYNVNDINGRLDGLLGWLNEAARRSSFFGRATPRPNRL